MWGGRGRTIVIMWGEGDHSYNVREEVAYSTHVTLQCNIMLEVNIVTVHVQAILCLYVHVG